MKSQFLIWAILGAGLTEAGAQIVGSAPNHYLKGINAIRYGTYFGGTAGSRCTINRDDWKIALKFVVNQSVNLKFIEDEEWDNRLHELSDRASSLAHTSPKWDPKAYKAATDELDEYGNIPELQITVTPIELDSGCAGTLIGELKTVVREELGFRPI
jgi:hypothetical protein